MKRNAFILALSAVSVLATSCKKEINGSGHFISVSRSVGPFSNVMASGDYTVLLVQDSITAVHLYGEDNILPELKTEVSGGELKICFDQSHYDYNHNGIEVRVHSPAFTKVSLSGSGMVKSTGEIHSGNFEASLSGSGKMILAVQSPTVSTGLSGSGELSVYGNAHNGIHRVSGSGNIHAFELTTVHTAASVSGSGTIRVHATQYLDATISGSGDIIYRGHPLISSHISGSGGVKPE